MSRVSLGAVLRHIHALKGAAASRRLTDSQLLRRFAEERDQDAFAELMRRHGPLVLSVCRRVLGHEQDAEDAFQAAFLVLARKAASIRKGESVGSFLYGVAYRIAMKERDKRTQRRQGQQQGEHPLPRGPVQEAAFRELQILLDEGLNRLPAKYRTPLPDGALARLGTIRFRQGYDTRQVAFSRDGKTIACAAGGRGVCLWDAATGKLLQQIDQRTHSRSLVSSPRAGPSTPSR